MPWKTTEDGWDVITIRWQSVPGYNYAEVAKKLSPEGRRQELELDWTASTGARIYSEYDPTAHLATEAIRFDPNKLFYCGWDFGPADGGTPAFVVTQLNAFGQWLIGLGLAPLPEHSVSIYDFGRMARDLLQREYALPFGKTIKQLRIIHVGDPAGANRPPRTGDAPQELRSCFDILKNGLRLTVADRFGRLRVKRLPGYGFNIQPGVINETERWEAVRARLRIRDHQGLPLVVVDPRNQCVADGFGGGYRRKQKADGTFEAHAEKNWYSHSMNAIEYVASKLFGDGLEELEDVDEDEEREDEEFASLAAGRRA